MDQSRTICPLLIKSEEKKQEQIKKEAGKYAVRPPRDMNSKYLNEQETRAKKKLADAAEKKRLDTNKESADE